MTTPASGTISLTDVMTELRVTNPGRAYPISLGDADVLALAGKGGPPISLTDLYNKTSFIALVSASASPSSVSGSGIKGFRAYTTTTTCTPNPSNATGLSYTWEYVSGSTFTVETPSASATRFSYIPTTDIGSRSGVYRCKVTQGGTTVYTGNVSVTIDWG